MLNIVRNPSPKTKLNIMNKQLEGLKAGLGNGLMMRVVTQPSFANQPNHEADLLVNAEHLSRALRKAKKPYRCISETLHLFPLSMLTEPIVVSGYNEGKEFVPMMEIAIIATDFEPRDMDRVRIVTIEGVGIDVVYDTGGEDDDLLFSIGFDSMEQAPTWVTQLFDKLHINWRKLDPDKFIDASVSKVYDRPNA